MYVRELMTARVISVAPRDTLRTARQLLRDNSIHHLIVLDRGELAGVLSYRELTGRADDQLVEEAMTRDLITVEPWATVKNAASLMIGRTTGCLPVVDKGAVTGIITTTDLLRAVSGQHVAHA